MMFGTLLFKEVREHLLTFRFGAALLATFVLVVVSFWVLGDDYLRRREAYNALSDEYAREAREVYVPSLIAPHLHRAPTPLSLFAQGETRNLGNTVSIRRWSVPQQASGSLTDNMLLAAYPSFDLLTIFTLVVSGFGILLSFDAFSGEKENGTLKLICSCPQSRGAIFTAKFTAGVFVLAIPFLLSVICGLLLVSFVHGIAFTPVQWLAVAVILLAGLIYGAVFIAVGMLCSALVRTSSAALILSLLIWTLGVLLIPIGANSLCAVFQPLTAPAEVDLFAEQTLKELQQRERSFMSRLRAGSMQFSGGFGDEDTYVFDANPDGFAYVIEIMRFQEPLYQKWAEDVWQLARRQQESRASQDRFRQLLVLPAPASWLHAAVTALAGTDYDVYRDFMESARRFRVSLLRTFRERGYFDRNMWEFISRRTRDEITDEKCRQRLEEYRRQVQAGKSYDEVLVWSQWEPLPPSILPPFDFPGPEPSFERTLLPLGALAFLVLFFFACGFVAFIRFDVR